MGQVWLGKDYEDFLESVYYRYNWIAEATNCCVIKRHLFTKRTQASAYNEVKYNLKQNELLIPVDYNKKCNNKQEWEIQSAYFGHANFSIFTASCYFKDESNVISKEAIAVTSESSDHLYHVPKTLFISWEKSTPIFRWKRL